MDGGGAKKAAAERRCPAITPPRSARSCLIPLVGLCGGGGGGGTAAEPSSELKIESQLDIALISLLPFPGWVLKNLVKLLYFSKLLFINKIIYFLMYLYLLKKL